MRITLVQSDASRFELDLTPPGGATRSIAFTDLIDVTLEFERAAGAARVRALRGTSAVLERLEWPLPHGGHIAASSSGGLSAVTIELDAASAPAAGPETTGRASLGRVDAGAVTIELGSGQRLAVDVGGRAVAVEYSPERAGTVAADRVELGNLQTALAGWLVRVSSAILDRPRVDWRGGGGELLFGASAARLGGVTLSGGGLAVELDRVELPEGVRTSGRTLVIPHLIVPELRIAADDLTQLFGRPPRAPDATAADTAAPAPAADHPGFDFGFLDRVTGRLDVDLTMELSIPVIGRRKATHQLRVPIVSGVINYRELERDLANLEDAFIDLEVRGHALVLERTIPLIPGLERPIVFWDLEPDELELARKRLVRLRTVPRLRLAPRVDKSERSSGFAVRRVLFDDIDIALSLAAPEPGQTDSVGRLSAAELRVSGTIDHDPQQTGPATELAVAAERIAAGPATLAVRGAQVELEGLTVASVRDATIAMDGARPHAARCVLAGLELRNLRVLLGLVLVAAALLSGACAGGGETPARADARPPPDAGPPGDARVGVDCLGMACAPEELCCRVVIEPPTAGHFCVPDDAGPGCDGVFDCDGPEDCASGLCCGGLEVTCAPPGQSSCTGGATVCHDDDDCGGVVPCCPTPSGVVKECIGSC